MNNNIIVTVFIYMAITPKKQTPEYCAHQTQPQLAHTRTGRAPSVILMALLSFLGILPLSFVPNNKFLILIDPRTFALPRQVSSAALSSYMQQPISRSCLAFFSHLKCQPKFDSRHLTESFRCTTENPPSHYRSTPLSPSLSMVLKRKAFSLSVH